MKTSKSEPDIIWNGYWQIRYTEPERIEDSAVNMEFGCPVPNLEDQVQIQKQIKNKSTKIIQIELKLSVHLAWINAATKWD